MSESMELLREWVDSFREDVATLKKVLESEKATPAAREFAAAALNYLVSRMDLIPDWTPTIGVIDDVLVLRLYVEMAGAEGLTDNLDAELLVEVGRLTNDADQVVEVVGADLYAKLRKHAARIAEDPVRGRRPSDLVEDADARKELYENVEDELLRMPAAAFEDADDVERKLRSYLTAKLKSV